MYREKSRDVSGFFTAWLVSTYITAVYGAAYRRTVPKSLFSTDCMSFLWIYGILRGILLGVVNYMNVPIKRKKLSKTICLWLSFLYVQPALLPHLLSYLRTFQEKKKKNASQERGKAFPAFPVFSPVLKNNRNK